MKNKQQEIQEAIQAADNTLSHLYAAKECLRKAGNWGIADLLGGGMISTFLKHNRMDDARQELDAAKTALRQFAGELADISEITDFDIPINDFLSFADYFFDGLIADWLMQKRIREANDQVAEAIHQVTQVRSQLLKMRNTQ